MIQKFDAILTTILSQLFVLKFALFVAVILHIEATFDSLLYIEFVVALLVALLTTM
jgi:hypothetical protein